MAEGKGRLAGKGGRMREGRGEGERGGRGERR